MSVPQFLTVAQVADRLGVAPGKVLGWVGSGELSAIDTSAARNQRPRWRIDPAEFERFLAGRRSTPPAKPARQNRRKLANVIEFISPGR